VDCHRNPQAHTGSVALAPPDGLPDEAFREMQLPVLVLAGTKDCGGSGFLDSGIS
jgi:hypothetical protein